MVIKEILEIPKYGCINVHASLLPKYRGSAPIQWAIINGDSVTGVTTMYMDTGMDTGDMILKTEVEIKDDDTYGTLYDKLKKAGGLLILKTLEKVADGLTLREEQSEDYTLAPMIEKTLGNIDWNNSSENIRNLIRGLNPMPGAYTSLNGNKMKIWNSEIIDSLESNDAPGTVIKANSKEGLYVKTGNGILKILELQMINSKRMLATDYLRGNVIEVGSILNS